jgi:hypothetical protein
MKCRENCIDLRLKKQQEEKSRDLVHFDASYGQLIRLFHNMMYFITGLLILRAAGQMVSLG